MFLRRLRSIRDGRLFCFALGLHSHGCRDGLRGGLLRDELLGFRGCLCDFLRRRVFLRFLRFLRLELRSSLLELHPLLFNLLLVPQALPLRLLLLPDALLFSFFVVDDLRVEEEVSA